MSENQLNRLKELKTKYYVRYILEPECHKISGYTHLNFYDLIGTAKRLKGI